MFAGMGLVVLAWFQVVDGIGPAVLWEVIGGAVRRVLLQLVCSLEDPVDRHFDGDDHCTVSMWPRCSSKLWFGFLP